ncbi:MAG: type II toxin-antitoxin system RatA family toxin [Robiginitomaculum sp.]|nr:type II toxin-antitoxin system RatA family toxin [Robiginitomaculum sp.]
MAKIHLQRHMPHSADDLLTMVADVEKYPEFIHLIPAVRILSREKISGKSEKFTADVGIKYKLISEQFRSEVLVDREAKTLSIKRAGHGGAVKKLENNWKFIPQEDSTTLIDFTLNVQLKALPFEFLIKQKFDKAANYIMNAFENRALEVCPIVDKD